ncbi:MAG: RNA-binding domain-containing protein [Clostridia bacterium]|jgi:ATP-dependent DNA helicase RecG|nr:putative DNA binding domain-containing protein [Clostridia bacterium]MED9924247.1 putative DNA binding domain-containing protein [Clostridia bacterium]CDC07249.1 putative transcriptional regulator [Clostridium sp. CAG:343]HCF34335.1 transcriptional regulator [Clostridiales bacterium]
MQNTETNRIENKEQLNEDFEQEVIAFLNYKEGGIIYVGINKNGQVVGVEDVDLTQLQIKDRIKNNIQPSTLGLFDVTVETIDNKEVIKVIISSGTEKPYYLRKKGRTPEGCYIRVGSSKERMTERMIDDMYAKRIKNTLKEIDSPRQELTFNQLKIYYEEHGLKLNDNYLQNLDLLTSEGKYNYNAFLLADENNVSIKLVKYVGTNKLELLENLEFGNRCLITATQRILDRLDVENTTYAKIEYFGRKEQEKIDSKALKEAVINAIVHNDYSYGNSPIIELYSDRIEITSAGGLPQELSQEEFLEGVTAPRNKELIRVFKDVDLIENIGSGVLRILDAYDKSCFKFMEHFLRVSFNYKENPFEYEDTAKTKSSKLGSKKSSKLAVSEEQILQLCKTEKSLKEIAQHFGYKDVYKFKNNYINKLIEQDKLQMTIPDKPKSRNQKYIIK